MKRFNCRCGQEVFFDNTHCGACGSQLGFDPTLQRLCSLSPGDSPEHWHIDSEDGQIQFRLCSHREHDIQCNWLIPAEQSGQQCASCVLTRYIPLLNKPENLRRWRMLESSKRRMIYGLLRLKLPLYALTDGHESGLVFDFLEDKRSNPELDLEHVLSGHANGVITINVAEADSSYREAAREAMNEPYRTLLGHFRHEMGHFYWDVLIKNTHRYSAFCTVFCYEQQDYKNSLDEYYRTGPSEDWQVNYISSYASAHPFEDWAETWAHYLLMMETLETAFAFGLIPKLEQDGIFEVWFSEWMQLVVVLNALNRSTGSADAYPFVVSDVVQQKLKFIHQLVLENQS